MKKKREREQVILLEENSETFRKDKYFDENGIGIKIQKYYLCLSLKVKQYEGFGHQYHSCYEFNQVRVIAFLQTVQSVFKGASTRIMLSH